MSDHGDGWDDHEDGDENLKHDCSLYEDHHFHSASARWEYLVHLHTLASSLEVKNGSCRRLNRVLRNLCPQRQMEDFLENETGNGRVSGNEPSAQYVRESSGRPEWPGVKLCTLS